MYNCEKEYSEVILRSYPLRNSTVLKDVLFVSVGEEDDEEPLPRRLSFGIQRY